MLRPAIKELHTAIFNPLFLLPEDFVRLDVPGMLFGLLKRDLDFETEEEILGVLLTLSEISSVSLRFKEAVIEFACEIFRGNNAKFQDFICEVLGSLLESEKDFRACILEHIPLPCFIDMLHRSTIREDLPGVLSLIDQLLEDPIPLEFAEGMMEYANEIELSTQKLYLTDTLVRRIPKFLERIDCELFIENLMELFKKTSVQNQVLIIELLGDIFKASERVYEVDYNFLYELCFRGELQVVVLTFFATVIQIDPSKVDCLLDVNRILLLYRASEDSQIRKRVILILAVVVTVVPVASLAELISSQLLQILADGLCSDESDTVTAVLSAFTRLFEIDEGIRRFLDEEDIWDRIYALSWNEDGSIATSANIFIHNNVDIPLPFEY